MNVLPDAPFVLPYKGVAPALLGPLACAEAGSAILGRVTLGARALLRRFAVLRGDGHVIEVGSDFHLGVHSTVHIAHALYGTMIGERVSVGANAVVHACTVDSDSAIEDGACVLDGAVVGSGSVIARGAVVFARHVIPSGHWCEGVPALPVRSIGAAALAAVHERIRAPATGGTSRPSSGTSAPADVGYVAATVCGTGEMRMGEGSSVWFGCIVDAARHGVDIAAGSNVQDNSILRSSASAITIGENSTVGHNVSLHDCAIGNRVLVGMGGTLAPGTVVMDEVLLAAGSTTTPGQLLHSGWLWGGRPARPIALLNDRQRLLIQQSVLSYREYAKAFAIAQAAISRTA